MGVEVVNVSRWMRSFAVLIMLAFVIGTIPGIPAYAEELAGSGDSPEIGPVALVPVEEPGEADSDAEGETDDAIDPEGSIDATSDETSDGNQGDADDSGDDAEPGVNETPGDMDANLQESQGNSASENIVADSQEAALEDSSAQAVTGIDSDAEAGGDSANAPTSHDSNHANVQTSASGSSAKTASSTKSSATPKAAKVTSSSKASTANKASATTSKPKTGKGDLAEGSYYIVSALLAGKVLDMTSGSTQDYGNAQLYDVNGTKAQQWVVTIAKDGFAIIKNANSGKVLDVSAAKNENCTNVQQYKSNGTKAQKWTIKKYGNRYVIISALDGNFVLDIDGAKTDNGANFQIYQRNNTKAQQFSFVSVEPKTAKAGEKTIENGSYTMRPLISATRVVGMKDQSEKSGGDARLYVNDSENSSQVFNFTYDGKGYYTITNVQSGMKLAPVAACSVSGVNVGQYKLGNVDRAKWVVTETAKGQFLIRNKATNLVLDIAGAKNADDTNAQLYTSNNTKAQRYALKSLNTLHEGVVTFKPLTNLDLSVDVKDASEKAGATLQVYGGNKTFAQKFRIAKKGNGYTVQAMNSGLYLTGSAKGGLTTQKAKSKWAGQIWIGEQSGGSVILKNATTGLVLDVKGASSNQGASLQTYKSNGTKAQKYIIRDVEVLSDGLYNIALSSDTMKVVSIQNGDRRNYANVRVFGLNGSNCQKFFISSQGGGAYSLVNPLTGRSIGVAAGSKDSGANVDMYTYSGSASQKWKVKVNADCTLTFVNAKSGKVLDVAGGKAVEGKNIQVYNSNGTKAQQFRLHATTLNLSEVVTLGVPCYNQNPQLPTGCESVALTNALRYWGFNLNKTTMANRMPRGSDGVYNFIGNPYDQSGWIICAPGITNMANSYLKSKGSNLRARNITGTSLKDLRQYLDKGQPVVVWTTIGMGQPVGLKYRHGYPLRGNNHAVVLSGYNPQNNKYQVADSLAGTVWRNGGSFNSLYNKMGKQAVVIEE